MSEWAERIRTAHARLGQVLGEREKLAATVSRLENELRDKERAADVLNARIAELERENEVLRAVRATPVAQDRSGTKERIDELVNEIDRCLELLKA
jgi:hypothetical protein